MASGGKVSTAETAKKEDVATSEISNKNLLLKPSCKNEFCLEVPTNRHVCDIVSACFMDDKTVILADKGNMKVIWLDTFNRGTIKNYCDLSNPPSQVCRINEQKVAVTVPYSQEIHFISLDSGMKKTNKIKLGIMCQGIAYANRTFYVSSNMGYIHKYALNGRKTGSFSFDQSYEVGESNPNHLAINEDASKIYVANGKHGLIVLDDTGKLIRKFDGPQLRNAQSCCLTATGNILVSGANSNNVVQLTADGELIGEVVKSSDGSGGVYAVSCNKEMSRICISRYNDNDIMIYYINENL